MKKIILTFSLILASATFVTAQAQHINVSININSQPAWGPVGYEYVDYYYIPEIDVYYNVPMARFYYWDRGRWVTARYLPYSYRQYDLYGMYKVVLNMNDPWRYHRHHIRDYGRYRHVRDQHVIYYTKDNRYNHSRRNTVAWCEGDRYNKPSRYRDDNRYYERDNDNRYHDDRSYNRSAKRNQDNYSTHTRSTRVDNDRYDNSRNNSRNNWANSRNQRSGRSDRPTENRNRREETTTRSSSQFYLVNNESQRGENRSSVRSSERSSSRSQSERSSNTRSNR